MALHTFVVKTVDAVNTCALVVAAEDEEVLRVLDLVRKEQADGLHALLAAVDVVTEEEIVRLRREAAILEQAQQVVVLPVDIACARSARVQAASPAMSEKLVSARSLAYATAITPRTANFDRRLQLQQNGLADQNFTGLGAEILDLIFLQLYLLARSAAADCAHVPYTVFTDAHWSVG